MTRVRRFWLLALLALLVAASALAAGYDTYLRFIWPLLLALFVVAAAFVALAATSGA